MQKSLNKKMGQATIWSGVTEISARLISPITNAVLARILLPGAFGVVATLTMVVSFAEIFTDAGFQKYLVQHEFKNEEDLDISTNVAFWTNLVFSFLMWIIIACFAEPIAKLTGAQGHESAIVAMCGQIPLYAFSSIQMARYRRDFNFKGLFVARMVVAFVPLVITVPMAIVFRNHWALVIGNLTGGVLNAVLLTLKSRWKPRFLYAFDKLKEMLSFSLWTMVENITIWLTSYIGVFIIANQLNEHYLGLYKTTISTVNAYMGLVTTATTSVLFSGLSRCQNNDEDFKEVFFRFQRLVALFIFPMGFGLFVYRKLATHILLGAQWMETADFLGLWCLTSAITVVFSHYNSEAFRSKGKPKLSILAQVLHLLVLVPVLLWSVAEGYQTLTVTRSLVRFQLIAVSCFILQLVVKIRFVDILSNVWPSLASTLIMTAVGIGLQTVSRHILFEIFGITLCILVYMVSMLFIPAGRRQLAEIPIIKKILRLE